MSSLIELTDLVRIFRNRGEPFRAVDGVSLNIAQGEVFGIIGHSGAGKSTLLRMINLLERPNEGRVVIDGVDMGALLPHQLRAERRKIGMIFQHFNLLFSKTVYDNIAMPLEIAGVHDETFIKKRVWELIDRVGLKDEAAKYPAHLSGGQKQRVGIARALATEPKILLCDEATSALDPQTTQSVLTLLSDISQELGLTIALITHEMDVIRRICDRVAVLDQGKVVELGTVADVFLHPKHPVTHRFVLESEHLDENEQTADFANVEGRLIRLTFRGDATYQPTLSKIMREADTDFSILYGRIDRIKQMPYGQLTLAIHRGDINALLARFEKEDVTLEVLR